MQLEPNYAYTGKHEAVSTILESINLQIDFLGVLEDARIDRNDFGEIWSRQDCLDWSIARPFSSSASRVLASHISASDLWATGESF